MKAEDYEDEEDDYMPPAPSMWSIVTGEEEAEEDSFLSKP